MAAFTGLVTGDEKLDRAIKQLETKAQTRVMAAGIKAALAAQAAGMRKAIPPQYKDARKAVKSRFKRRASKGIMRAVVGLGVGRKLTDQDQDERKRAGRRGVGISARNVHWFALGTVNMPAQIPNVVRDGSERAKATARARMIKAMRRTLAREAAKARAR